MTIPKRPNPTQLENINIQCKIGLLCIANALDLSDGTTGPSVVFVPFVPLAEPLVEPLVEPLAFGEDFEVGEALTAAASELAEAEPAGELEALLLLALGLAAPFLTETVADEFEVGAGKLGALAAAARFC